MSELQNTIVSKVDNNHTYITTANYWAPLAYDDEEEDFDLCSNMADDTNQVASNINTDTTIRWRFKQMLLSWMSKRMKKNNFSS